ncbi:cerebrin prohormone-like [Mizuhopecten yessoensis]|uniref:Cerebrin n=1 Tax=Mizuhopecten yessoensis TaxID=6573 RepID=A0A346GAS8_MIZYE|nr:cerebrin prohormone-like [Mizuhopecten yessoensis]AXN93481.1 cerebrin [Mizuhopecten yessoensis]
MPCRSSLVCLGLVFIIALTFTRGSARSFQASLDQRERQDIMVLAARIIKIAMSASSSSNDVMDKRNAGTIDSLYNLPDLFAAGR